MAIRRTRTPAQVATGLSAIGAVTAAGLVGVVSPAAADTPSEPAQRPGTHTRPVPVLASNAERTHTVRPGETVSAIAVRYGTTITAIVRANDLNARAMIYAGQVLTIPTSSGSSSSAASPGSSTSASPSTAPGTSTYTVVSGDTLSGIAAQHDTTVTQLMSSNALSSSLIHPGQKLTISGESTSTSTSSGGTGATAPTTGSTYTVRSADTVSAIAARFGSTVGAIVAANDLNSRALIRIGQVLTIPGSTTSSASNGSATSATPSASTSAATSYTVASGDTLSGIAAKHNTSVGAITTLNDLSSSVIYPGQVLKIQGQLVPSTFLHYTYPDETVAAANQNKQELLDAGVPSKQEMRDIIRTTAQQLGVDPALALAVAQQESGFDQTAVSPANAIGAMQVIPTSGEWASDMVGRDLDLLDPHDNAVAGVAILRWLVRNAPDLPSAIAGYYQGMGSVNRNGMYSDTRRYVANVQTLMTRYA